MEQNKMTFDELWNQEEQQGLLSRLKKDYPAWQRHRRVRHTVLASVAVLAVTVGIALHSTLSTLQSYDAVCCNRTTFPESHWAEVAANILTTQMI